MCAQFRNHHVEHSAAAMSPVPMQVQHQSLVLLSNVDAAIARDLAEAKARYDRALSVVEDQRVVLETLESMVDSKVPCQRLRADVATQTDVSGRAGDLPLQELLHKKFEVQLWRMRRENAQACYAKQLAVLRSELQELKDAAEDIVPRGVAMLGVAREGRIKDV